MPTNNLYSIERLPIRLTATSSVPSEILVLPVGSYKTYIGDIDINDALLSAIVANFERGVPHKELPVDERHTDGVAPGWIKKLTHKIGDGLYATVDWTSYGAKLLTDKLYRYVSAEFSTNYIDSTFGKEHGPALAAVALTNRPMLQNIPALLSQGGKQEPDTNNPIQILFSQEGASMNLDEIRAKDAAELTDEERTFLQEHAAELNDDERTRFEIEAPEAPETPEEPAEEPETPKELEAPADPAEPTELSQGKSGTIQLSAAEYQALKINADKGAQALLELSQNRMRQEIVEPMLFSQTNRDGAFLPKSKDKLTQFVFGLTDVQRKEFSALVAELPKNNTTLLSEVGHGQSTDSAGSRLNQLAQAKVEAAKKDGQEITFSQALDQVAKENPELVANEYSYEGAE